MNVFILEIILRFHFRTNLFWLFFAVVRMDFYDVF